MLEFVERALDEIAFFIKVFVKISGFFAIGFGRNNDLGHHSFCRIISLVRQHSFGFQAVQQGQSFGINLKPFRLSK